MTNFLHFTKTLSRYREIKQSKEAETSRRFGVGAIVLAIVFAAVSLAIPFSLRLLGGAGWAPIGGIILLVVAAAMLLALLAWMVLYVILQWKLNRSAISIVSLVCLIASLAAAAVIVVLLNG